MTEEQFVCAVSGVASDAAEDGELPVGWAQVSVLVRQENPKYVAMVQARDAVIDQQLAGLPEEQREAGRAFATVLATASFAAMEDKTPRYLVEEYEVHVSAEQLPTLLEMLGEAE